MSKLSEQAGQLIRQTRKDKGLTQKQLGELLNIGESTVNKYESGKHNMTLETLERVSEALRVKIKLSSE